MKIQLLLIGTPLLFLSCGTSSEATNHTPPPPEAQDHFGRITTQYSAFGCGYLISIEEGNIPELINPVNLPDEFKVNGIEVRFRYQHAEDNGACDMARPVILEKIKKLSP